MKIHASTNLHSNLTEQFNFVPSLDIARPSHPISTVSRPARKRRGIPVAFAVQFPARERLQEKRRPQGESGERSGARKTQEKSKISYFEEKMQ